MPMNAAPALTNQILVGILVGGKSSRMGGYPKGLLRVPDSQETIIDRTIRIVGEIAPNTELLLVGDSGAYADFGYENLADDPPDIGPVGGLRSLLKHGASRGHRVLALGCDMPYLSSGVLEQLMRWPKEAAAVCPRRLDRWEPLCARYSPAPCLEALESLLTASARSGARVGFRHLLNTVDTQVLPLDNSEQRSLRDWDKPEDIS